MNLSFQSLVVRGAAALFCFGLVCSVALSPAGASLVTGRTAYWQFNETGGTTTAANSGTAGTALNGTLVGGANIGFAAGLFGNAVWLGGSSSADPSVDVASAVIAGSQTAYTISLWFNPADIKTSDARRQVFIETYDGSSYGISAGLIAGNNRVHHYTRTGSGNTTLTATTAVTPPQDEWHHLAITFGGSTSKIYINGTERAEGQIVSVTSVPATTAFRIGRHRTTPGTSFNGMIDDMAIWDGRTLTDYEVHAIHRMGRAGYALDSDMTVHVKANNTTNLNQAGSWESGGAPGASSYLVFDTTFDQTAALDTGGALSVAGLRVTSGTNLISINNTSANYLQIGAAGVDMTTAARDLSVANLQLGASQSWDIANARMLTVGSLSGNHALTKTGGGTLAITGAGSPIGGTTVTGGTLQIGNSDLSGAGGSLTTTSLHNGGGTLALYKGVLTINGGAFTPVQTGNFHVGSGGPEDTMVVRLNSGASSAIPGELRFNAGSTLELNNSTATVSGNIIIGAGVAGTGKILVNGATASLTGSGIVGVGGNAQTGYLTVSDGAQVTLTGGGKFGIADSVASNSKGYVTVESGGSISVGGDVYIGSADMSGQVGRLTVTGAGSSFQKTGAGATIIGGTSQGDGTVVIAEGGSMSMAGDGITINPRGTLTIGKSDFTGPGSLTTTSLDVSASGAKFNLYAGTVTIDGGAFKRASGDYILEPGGIDTAVINLLNGAEMEVVGLLRLQVGSTLNVTDSTANVTGFIGVGSRNSKSGTGKMVVDGTNAEVTTDSYMWVGGGGATGRVTVRNGGSLNVAQYLAMVDSTTSSTKAYIDVESGGSITVGTGDILIGTRGASGQVAQMTLDGAGSAVSQNGSGALRIGAASGTTGGLLTISGGTFTTGTGGTVINATGTLNLQGGTFNTPSLDDSHGKLSFTGGRLEVKDFTGSLLNEGGVYAPGLSPAVSSITGDYTQEASGTIEMELGGTVLGSEYDHLDIFGDATLNGTLRVVLIDSFEPAAGNTFDLFDYHGGVSGDFAVYDLPTLAGANIWWDHSLVSTTGILRVVPEPTTAVMVLFGVLILLVNRRRRAA